MSGEANTSYVRKRGKVDFSLDSGDDSDEWGGAKGGEEEESSSSSDDSADETRRLCSSVSLRPFIRDLACEREWMGECTNGRSLTQ